MILPQTINIDIQGTSTEINELDIILIDRPSIKTVTARVHPLAKPLVLWRGQGYDDAGDYTQQQAEERVLTVLGEDLQAGLQLLFNIEVL